jgi:Mlc titration factor MtfA (ptsG expression regulator)
MSETLDIERAEEILSINFDYYKKLSQEDKQRFTDRLEKFLKGKEFFPRNGVELSGNMDEIKTFVSAAAIQVTFGLEEYVLGHFSKIFIFPSSYYSKITHKYHIGEANPLGALVFS